MNSRNFDGNLHSDDIIEGADAGGRSYTNTMGQFFGADFWRLTVSPPKYARHTEWRDIKLDGQLVARILITPGAPVEILATRDALGL
jgi:hypothetical protein